MSKHIAEVKDHVGLKKEPILSKRAKRELRRKKLAAVRAGLPNKFINKPSAQPATSDCEHNLSNNVEPKIKRFKNEGDKINRSLEAEFKMEKKMQKSKTKKSLPNICEMEVKSELADYDDVEEDGNSMDGERDDSVDGERHELSLSRKRKLRRERMTAFKSGVEVAYDPVSNPPSKDEPPLTNHAKRMIRKRKKFDKDCLIYGEDEMNKRMEAAVSEQKKKQRKRQKSKLVICTTEIESQSEKLSSKSNPQHIKFSANKDRDEQPTKLVKIEPQPDKINVKSNLRHIKFSDSDETDELPTKLEKAEDGADSLVESSSVLENPSNDGGEKVDPKSEPTVPAKKRRFILFVGNLSYDTTEDDIQTHFSKVGQIINVRMPKPFENDSEHTCRGFCYLEVKDEETYLKGLSMHHSYMAKRKINVEYSSAETKKTREEQKQKRTQLKAMKHSGDMFELLNPTHGSSKFLGRTGGKRISKPTQGPTKAVRRTTAKRDSQHQGNKFWV